MVIYFITGSKHKFEEINDILKDSIEIEMLSLNLPEIQELDARKIIEEKLQEALKLHPNKTLFVEDTSLHLDCINGFPGPLIKWMQKAMSFQEIYELCEKYNNYNAEARTLIGYAHEGKIDFFEGKLKGKIVPQGNTNGFGWDCIFVPEGLNHRYSDMSKEEKNKISHRAKATIKFKDFLS